MTSPMKIQVENVSKIFGPDPKSALALVRAGMGKTELLEQTNNVLGLHDISLNIPAGQTYVIMGLSGSGKSTLIRHFNRLIDPTAGRILVDGEDILTLAPAALRAFRRKKVSMVFQRFALLPHKTVLENVMFGLLVDGVPKATARAKAMAQVEMVGLSGFEHHFPGQLSGGMQQRVGLARALATDAEILLMDEAFSALDPLIRHDMQMQLRDIQSRLHKTIVFITHDLDEALLLGDHIAILKDGLLRQVGTGEQILMTPADDYVARFVRDVNRARIVTCGALAVPGVATGDAAVDAGQPVEAAFAALAASEDPVAVRATDGSTAGVLTRARVFEALTRR
jgi:glycine betaine/proline transport system ATP-binding protein